MKKWLAASFVTIALAGIAFFWFLSKPQTVDAELLSGLDPDLANGELVFWAGGCASCHAAEGAEGADKLLLGGGHRLETPFGTFVTPNISPDAETGIGGWSRNEFLNAMVNGVSPGGKHYYPSFPYASYARMTPQDVLDLFAYIRTLPAVEQNNEDHELPLPFRWRRTLGIWKALFVSDQPMIAVDPDDAIIKRGQYLVEGLGHCGECHTPRNLLGGPEKGSWLAGGPAPEGDGKIPNITPHPDGIESWSEGDIVYYLESGFTPDYDSVGGSMVDVQQNMAKLSPIDLEAIAAYLKAVPAAKTP